MWGFLETICFDCLIVFWRLNQQGPDNGLLSGWGACRMIANGSPVSQVQHLDACLPPTSSPLTVRVTILVLAFFFRVSIKRVTVRKENSIRGWVVYILTSYLRPMTICLLWMSWNTWIIFFWKKKWNTFCKVAGSSWNLHHIFEKMFLKTFQNVFVCKCIKNQSLKTLLK